MQKKFLLPELNLELEVGKFAQQADGAAWVKINNNVVLSTVVSAAKSLQEFPGFFPLMVEYREKVSAAGKIPGGYFKREGRLSDHEILTSRLIDRPIRPLFPKYYFNDVQIISTVYSSDGKFPMGVLALISASIALTISDLPFLGPIGAVQLGRVGGQWKFNLTHDELQKSDANIIIAGTKAGISMVEGNCNNVSEKELVDLFFEAHEQIKRQVEWQEEIQSELGIIKKEAMDSDWIDVEQKISGSLTEDLVETIFNKTNKKERSAAVKSLQSSIIEKFSEEIKSGKFGKDVVNYLFDQEIKGSFCEIMIKKQTRIDGRSFDKVRSISTEVGFLPASHGSSLFNRGETQALASVTLGTSQDAQKVDDLISGMFLRHFMLHYNFPPFSVGEVRPVRGVGRREVGHGYLAETSFYNVLPSQEDFPYTIRSVVDVLGCNGSSSMATVCSTTMALMDAGVPLKSMVSGIAMGLVRGKDDSFHVLTDILGTEDAFGLMDFKVTGTDDGIMAFQLDIKDKVGLPKELLAQALSQAKIGRDHIMGEMKKVLSAPREDVSSLAPRVSSFKISQDKIGAIIGPGGKIIKEIIAATGTQIDIEDDGTVKIFSTSGEGAKKAENWIKTIAGNIEAGTEYEGIIKRVADFGVFVELVPGKEGLIHVSSISKKKQQYLSQICQINDKLNVKVISYEAETGRVRLKAQSLLED